MEKVAGYLLRQRATLQKEWQVVSAVALMVGVFVWLSASFINSERFATLAERIALKDDEIAQLRSERDRQSGRVSSLEATLSEVLSRLKALEEKALTSVLQGHPANVEVIAGPKQTAWGDYLKGTFTESGWNVEVGDPEDLISPNLTDAAVLLRPIDLTSGDTIRQALEAAKIPYENLTTMNGIPEIRVIDLLRADIKN